MKIGPFTISRIRRTPAGLEIYPWQALTEDRVSPELRQIVAKVARSEAKSYLESLREEATEATECTGAHLCRSGHMIAWCRESCTNCMGEKVRPCDREHPPVTARESV